MKISIKKLLIKILVLTFLSGSHILAQGRIMGSVKDSVTKQKIPYATLSLTKSQDSTVITGDLSNEEGEFEIEKIPFGKYDLKASFLGYNRTFIRNIIIDKDNRKLDLGSISLLPKALETGEVTVTAEKDLVTYEIDKKIVNVDQHINAKGGMAADVLENISSIRVDVDGNVALRGSQNFTVLIDGKPTVLSNQEVLQQIPAELIENIEIITNPSAKYDPQGTAGILNLVMKKDRFAGMNGLINLTAGTRDKYNGTMNMNYRTNQMNMFSSFSYYDRSFFPTSDFIKQVDYENVSFFSNPYLDREMNSRGYTLNLGTDYSFNDMNTLSISGSFGDNAFNRLFPAQYTEWQTLNNSAQREAVEYSSARDEFIINGYWGNVNVNHQIKFSEKKNHELQTNLSLQRWDGDISQSHARFASTNDFNMQGDLLNSHTTFNDGLRNDINFQMDFSMPLSEISTFEAGIQSNNTIKEFDFLYENFDVENQTWITNPQFTNITNFYQSINAVYATYSNRLFDINYRIGMRGEYYTRNLEQITLQEEYGRDVLNLFPSAHLSYNLAQGMDLQLSYSRRVQRPDDRNLNPFPDYSDEDFISTGNPDLNSQFTDSYELNYQYAFGRNFISVETYYRHSDDLISQVMIPFDSTRILITAENADEDHLYGAQLSVNANPFSWLRVFAAANLYQYFLNQTRDGEPFNRNMEIFDMNGNLTFIINPTTFIQLSGNYIGERLTINGINKPVYLLNATVRKDFFDRKLTAILNVRDMFATGRYDFESDVLNFTTNGYMQPEQQIVSLTLSYRINNYQRRDSGDVNIDLQNGI